jgi:mannosyltransferase
VIRASEMGVPYPPGPMESSRTERPWTGRLAVAGLVAVVVAGVALRLDPRSDLWLDEALSVNIASLPVGDLLDQLAHDGHPPLYYLLLHAWMEVFGSSDLAVRLLSGVFGLATIPLCWFAARRHSGREAATAALVLAATSPFLVRYAFEARMYSMVALLVTLGWLTVTAALRRPTRGRLLAVAVLSGSLALTHYWSLYLLAVVGALLALRWRQGVGAAGRVLGALAAGGVLFLPWLPTFLDQAAHTGTPWGRPATPAKMVMTTFFDLGGPPKGESQLLGVVLLVLVGLGLAGRAAGRFEISLDLRTRVGARNEIVVIFGTLALACVAGFAAEAAFASRYTAVVVPLILLAAALGVTTIGDARARGIVLAVLALAGLLGSARYWYEQRSQGGQIGAYIMANGAPGDVVAFCPDQLGPSTLRHVGSDREALAFPDGSDPRLVDWAEYEERQAAGDPEAFAARLDAEAGTKTVWIVWSPEYRTLGTKCEQLVSAMTRLRPGGTPVVAQNDAYEHAWLYQYGPVPG